jgi:hypothetical protein
MRKLSDRTLFIILTVVMSANLVVDVARIVTR